jgi:hypothetical protein
VELVDAASRLRSGWCLGGGGVAQVGVELVCAQCAGDTAEQWVTGIGMGMTFSGWDRADA